MYRLSGLSPFSGVDDEQTAENIKRCELVFPSDAFAGISDHGKDFIRKLLLKNKASRLNVYEALEHPWLLEDSTDSSDSHFAGANYDNIRAKIKSKYATWPEPAPAIGRLANYSSLKKHRPKEYNIYDSFLDKRDASPRFVLKPRNQHVREGDNATFKCVILAASPPVVSWHQGGAEIKQSIKHMKKYNHNSYMLEVRRCTMDDQGEYIIKAANSYGEREYNVFLTVDRKQTNTNKQTYIWQDLTLKGSKKRSFEISHCLRCERNSYKKCSSDKIVFPHRFNIAKNLAFCLICKI